MKFSIIYHSDIPQDIASLPKNIKLRIKKAIEMRLLVDPVKYGEPLRRTLKGYRKMRVGDYRVIYSVKLHKIIVLKIGHRKEVYKKQREGEG